MIEVKNGFYKFHETGTGYAAKPLMYVALGSIISFGRDKEGSRLRLTNGCDVYVCETVEEIMEAIGKHEESGSDKMDVF